MEKIKEKNQGKIDRQIGKLGQINYGDNNLPKIVAFYFILK